MEVKEKVNEQVFINAVNASINAMSAAVKMIGREIKSDAPIEELRSGISYRVDKTINGIEGQVLGPWYWHFFEFGTSAHEVAVKRSKVLSGAGIIYGTKAFIPGITGKSFVRKNVDEKKDQVYNIILEAARMIWHTSK